MSHEQLVLWCGLGIGIVFGVAGQRSGFCLTGGLREWLGEGDDRRIGAFALAVAVAIAGSQLVAGFGLVDLGATTYLQQGFSWLLLPVGGIAFGYGMALANGCGSRALVLLASGNLRSLLVLLCLGVSAYVALTGLLAPLRLAVAEASTVAPALPQPSLPALLGTWGLDAALGRGLAAGLVAALLGGFALSRPALRRAPGSALAAVLIGALVPAGWIATGYLGADDFDPVRVVSLTFVAPIGDTIQYLMFSTGTRLEFGVSTVAGVLAGAAAAALWSGSFRLEGFASQGPMLRTITGGVLMGIGGALALGCSIGQGLSGLSTLALPSFLSAGGILAGAAAGLHGPLRAR